MYWLKFNYSELLFFFQKGDCSDDNILTVKSHMEHIISLLSDELERSKDNYLTVCINHFLKNNILAKVGILSCLLVDLEIFTWIVLFLGLWLEPSSSK